MAVVTTNLGTITAYGDAVAAGYTGTKAQWQALMANYATVGQQAAQDAQTASQAAQTATTKAGEASQSATSAAASAASITTPDATLTQAGVAADAKATGDEISDLKEGFNTKINAFTPVNYAYPNYRINVSGSLVGDSGCEATGFIECKTGMLVQWYGKSFYYQGSPAMLCLSFYDGSKTLIPDTAITQVDESSATVNTTGYIAITVPETAKYFRASTRYETGSYCRLYDVQSKLDELFEIDFDKEFDDIDKEFDSVKYPNTLKISGNGSTKVDKNIKFVVGNSYRVDVLNPTWAHTSAGSGADIFFLRSSDGTHNVAEYLGSATTVNTPITFTAASADYILTVRANAGESVFVCFTDTTSSKNVADEVDNKIDALSSLFLKKNIPSSKYVIIPDSTEEIPVKLTFSSQSGNRVYCGGKNLFDGTIKNIAISTVNNVDTVVYGSNYRGFYVPIKGGLTYTVSRSAKSSNRFRVLLTVNEPVAQTVGVGNAYDWDDRLSHSIDTSNHPEAKYLAVYLSNSGEDVSTTDYQVEIGGTKTDFADYDGVLTTTNSTAVDGACVEGTTYAWCDSGNISADYITPVTEDSAVLMHGASNTGNFSIACAKEHAYSDGTATEVEYYLIEEVNTKRFYITKDLKNLQYAFTASFDTYKYAFGITANGDVVACQLADTLSNDTKSDNNRTNPYCWLASEHWDTQHVVDFNNSLKPCGWLSSCGFRVLDNGKTMFAEYTRPNLETSNTWMINGDPTDASNWVVKKSFTVTSIDNQTGFKHTHMVTQDQYTGTIYISTGDDNDNSMIWYTTDYGDNWTQLGTANEKYCRNLSITFTKDYVYWAPDTSYAPWRYLFKAERDGNGIIDIANVVDWVVLGGGEAGAAVASYGTAYIPELNCVLILDKCDGLANVMDLNVVDLENGTLHKVYTIESVGSETDHIGFRTRYSEWYPRGGNCHIGFGLRVAYNTDWVNHNKGYGNMGYSNIGSGANNINNVCIHVLKNGSDFTAYIDTAY